MLNPVALKENLAEANTGLICQICAEYSEFTYYIQRKESITKLVQSLLNVTANMKMWNNDTNVDNTKVSNYNKTDFYFETAKP